MDAVIRGLYASEPAVLPSKAMGIYGGVLSAGGTVGVLLGVTLKGGYQAAFLVGALSRPRRLCSARRFSTLRRRRPRCAKTASCPPSLRTRAPPVATEHGRSLGHGKLIGVPALEGELELLGFKLPEESKQARALLRNAVFGFEGWEDLARVGVLVVFGLVMWRIAINAMTRKLID